MKKVMTLVICSLLVVLTLVGCGQQINDTPHVVKQQVVKTHLKEYGNSIHKMSAEHLKIQITKAKKAATDTRKHNLNDKLNKISKDHLFNTRIGNKKFASTKYIQSIA